MTDKIDTTLLSLRGRMGAHKVHAMYDSREITKAGRVQARINLETRLTIRFKLDPDAPDYQRRLKHAISYHYAEMSHKAVMGKKKKRQQRERRAQA